MKHITSVLAILLLCVFSFPAAHGQSKADLFKNPQTGDLSFSSLGRLAFGPDGLLLASDPRSASIVAVQTGDLGPTASLAKKIDNINATLAGFLKSEASNVKILDMAANPASGRIWFSVNSNPGNKPRLLAVSSDGTVSEPDLSKMTYVRIQLSVAENAKLRNLTDLAWADDSVVVAGQSSDEFANKIFQIPVPLEHGENARFYSAETYHVAHRRWETKSADSVFYSLGRRR